MKLTVLVTALLLMVPDISQAQSVTLSFDDVPEGVRVREYYGAQHGIIFAFGFYVADHTESTWGPPLSGSSVLRWREEIPRGCDMVFKKYGPWPELPKTLDAYSVAGYFSTEPGVVLEMIGYSGSFYNPVVTALIGAPGEAWRNVYIVIDSPSPINAVVWRPVTSDALLHFCMDDLTVEFVPEPTSLATITLGLAGLGVGVRKRVGRREG